MEETGTRAKHNRKRSVYWRKNCVKH